MQHTDLSQNVLLNKMQVFLTSMDETLPIATIQETNGVCNGLVFAAMRAHSIGQRDKFFERLSKIAGMDDEKIEYMGSILRIYKKKLAEFSTDKSHQSALNAELATLKMDKQEKEIKARFSGGDSKVLNENLQRIEKEYQAEIVRAREKYYKKNEAEAIQFANHFISKFKLSKDTLAEAQDFYAFIHLVLAAFHPTSLLQLEKEEGKPVLQSSYIDLLRFLPPDELITLKEDFSFQFLFTKPELVTTLEKCLQPGDQVRLVNTNHAIYLTVEENGYTLYDPSSKEMPITFRTIDELVDEIEVELFKNFNIDTDILPVSMIFFKMTDNEEKLDNRDKQNEAKINHLLQSILDGRSEKDKNINLRTWDGMTALQFTTLQGNVPMVKALLARGADSSLGKAGYAPIHSAATIEHVDAIRALAENQADLNQFAEGDDGLLYTAAHIVVGSGKLSTLKVLAECGADFSIRDSEGTSPILCAVEDNRFDMAALMLIHVKEPSALSANWKEFLSVEHVNALVKESIKIIKEMNVPDDEKMRLFEKILNQENALGKILHSYKINNPKSSAYMNTGTIFDSKQKISTDYLTTIQAEYHALRANKTASNSSVILPPQRKAS